jgi:AAA15 family ATPase/GTPase
MEKITNIEIKNFKSIRHQTIEGCKRINVFVGPPNVGKSNVLEALSLFGLLNLAPGGALSLQNLTRINKSYQLFFDGLIKDNCVIALNNDVKVVIEIKTGFEIKFSALGVHGFWVKDINDYKKNEREITFKSFECSSSSTKISDNTKLADITFSNNSVSPIKKYIFSKLTVNDQFDTLTKSLISPFGENISDIIFSIPDVKKKVIELFDLFNLKISRSEAGGGINLLKQLADSSFLILDFELIAETLQRLVFHQAAILSNENSVLLFEEPESHMYEPYILEFTNAIKNDKNNNQFFIVTHSQYVIEELLRDEESRNDTNIYLVGLENNETKIKLMSPEKSKDVYQTGLNIFFNYQSLWDEN